MIIDRTCIGSSLAIENHDGRYVSYEDFLRQIDFWREYLTANALVKGSRVVLNIPSGPELHGLFFACLELGIVFIGIADQYYHEIPRYAEIQVDLAIVPNERYEIMRDALSYRVVALPDVPDLSERPVRTGVRSDCEPSDFAVMAVTSGSTGKPKMILHTHETLVRASRLAADLYYDQKKRVALWHNINHLGVLTSTTLPAFFSGCRLVIFNSGDAPFIADLMMNRRIDHLLMFTWNWFQAIDYLRRIDPDYKSKLTWSPTVITGGSVAEKPFLESMFDHGVREVHVIYGSTEVPVPVIAKTARPEDVSTYDASCLGTLVGPWEYKLTPSDHKLMLRGGGVGYNAAGESLNSDDGWYSSGDQCEIVDGKLYFCSRGEHIKRNGHTIFLEDLETLTQHFISRLYPGMMKFLNVSFGGQERIVLAVVNTATMLNPSEEFTVENLNRHLHKFLTEDHRIDHIVLLETLPNNNLKTDVPKLTEIVLEKLASGERSEYR